MGIHWAWDILDGSELGIFSCAYTLHKTPIAHSMYEAV